MDIATNPTTPDGNPEMADAAPEPQQPELIRRKAYRPFGWLVPEPARDFDLGLARTRITATLSELGRNAIPVYALYLPGEARPRLLPEVLTATIVLDEISKLPSSKPATAITQR